MGIVPRSSRQQPTTTISNNARIPRSLQRTPLDCQRDMTYRFPMRRAGMLAAVLAACTSSVPLDKYDDELLQARCQRFVRCGLFVDDDSCEAYFRILPDVNRQPALDAGKLKYDGEAAKRCDDAIAAQTCDGASRDGRLPPAACAKVFVGQV